VEGGLFYQGLFLSFYLPAHALGAVFFYKVGDFARGHTLWLRGTWRGVRERSSLNIGKTDLLAVRLCWSSLIFRVDP